MIFQIAASCQIFKCCQETCSLHIAKAWGKHTAFHLLPRPQNCSLALFQIQKMLNGFNLLHFLQKKHRCIHNKNIAHIFFKELKIAWFFIH